MGRFQRMIIHCDRLQRHNNSQLSNDAYVAFGQESKRYREIFAPGEQSFLVSYWPDLCCHYIGLLRPKTEQDYAPTLESNDFMIEVVTQWIWSPRTKAGELWLLTSAPAYARFWPDSAVASGPTGFTTNGIPSKSS